MSDLRDWLRRNNLEQLADTFEANDIDLDVLPDLSERDLEQLGLSLGNRRRLLKAIASLAASGAGGASSNTSAESSAVHSSAASSSSAHSSAEGPSSGDAERRQVTVMFADMVGSTALSAKVDPELLGGLIRRYQDAVAGAIGRYGGFVAKFMGDGVLAYFGFPRAFEDAAERSVRAAIDMLAEVGGIELPDDARVQARIGIATGLVVVGEIIGTGSAQERTIIGETPNLAARLQALAGPDNILVSESTQKLLGGLFELTHTGEHDLKGFARPVPVWQVCGETSVESRFAASRIVGSLPLIGRAHEMGLLRERWQLARQGEGQIVTVTGEAGIGKSRTIEALQEELAAEPHARVNLQCSPYRSDSALYPVIQYLNRAARFTPTDTPDGRIEKLRAWLAKRGMADASRLPLLAELLSIPLPGEAPSELTSAQRKASTLALIVNMLIGLGNGDPALVVLEDAHWIDATTLDMMMRLTDSIGDARLLAVVTARPEFVAPWLARPQATLVSLGRLGRRECMQVIAGVATAHGLPADTVAAIVAKTDGVPLFIEELTRTVMESAGDTAVPATLKDSLMARLDRLGGARDVAQIAAVIGRQFTFCLLEAVASKNAGELDGMLAKLVAAGIVFPEERGLQRSFIFKHALVRDAAYESLLLMRRREWHERVAYALERSFADIAAKEPELLAYHFGEAGLLAPGCDYRMRAGDLALGRSAYAEAIAHFSAGLKLAERMPPQEGMRRQLEFWLKLGSASVVAHGLQSAEAEQAYTRASEIGEKLGDGPKSFQAKWGLWVNANLRPQDGAGPRPRQRAPEARAKLRRWRIVARSLSLPIIDGTFSRRCRRHAGGRPQCHRAIRYRTSSPPRARVWRPRPRRLRPCPVRQRVAVLGRGTKCEPALRAGDCACRNARPSQQPRARAAQHRHRPSAWRRPRGHLQGRASGGRVGGEIRSAAMACEQPRACGVGHRSRLGRRGCRAADRGRDRRRHRCRSVAAILSGPRGGSPTGRWSARGRARPSRPGDCRDR